VDLLPQPCKTIVAATPPAHLDTGQSSAAIDRNKPEACRFRQPHALPNETSSPLAGAGNHVKNDMPAFMQIVPNTPKGTFQMIGYRQVVQRVECAGDEIDGPRQPQLAQVLVQEQNILVSGSTLGFTQHLKRAVDAIQNGAAPR
jgi:hypothetical protein